ncbi:MAG: UDP-N-acetylmuramoylalanyl-D-glutamate--2,6-diaminopimelate ligase [Treponema sp.]|nr:UDP-N-acetylmuramoylalanyl-D-glutamate--2,6-diaminopimelate ligase [Treponema sp.]
MNIKINANKVNIEELVSGDLLFMRDASEFSKVIIDTTSNYSHVGIYLNGKIYHATRKKGVVKQDFHSFLKEEKREIFVYRYPDINVENVIAEAEKHLGKDYNDSFYPDNGKFYCSQYVAAILPIFSTIPMQFGDKNNKISDYWKNYYKDLGLAVPLDVEGTNPNQLSESEKLVFIGELKQS